MDNYSGECLILKVETSLPGAKPVQNAHIERFNGKFLDECLNLHWFGSIAEAESVV